MFKLLMIASSIVSFNSGATSQCDIVTISPYAEKETLSVALADASALVALSGCVNIVFDDDINPLTHNIDMAVQS